MTRNGSGRCTRRSGCAVIDMAAEFTPRSAYHSSTLPLFYSAACVCAAAMPCETRPIRAIHPFIHSVLIEEQYIISSRARSISTNTPARFFPPQNHHRDRQTRASPNPSRGSVRCRPGARECKRETHKKLLMTAQLTAAPPACTRLQTWDHDGVPVYVAHRASARWLAPSRQIMDGHRRLLAYAAGEPPSNAHRDHSSCRVGCSRFSMRELPSQLDRDWTIGY